MHINFDDFIFFNLDTQLFGLHAYLAPFRVHRKLSSSNSPGSLFGFNTGIRSHSRSDESSFFFKGVLIPHAHGAWYSSICCLTSPKGLFLSTLKTGETMWAEFWSGFSLCCCHRVNITEVASTWLCYKVSLCYEDTWIYFRPINTHFNYGSTCFF